MAIPRRLSILLFAVVIGAVFSFAADSVVERGLDAAGSVYACATWAPRVSLSRRALDELRERMAHYQSPAAILITGPMEQDCRAPESVKEAWLIEKLYGPSQRWILSIVSLDELAKPIVDVGEQFHVREVSGIAVAVHTSRTVSHLHVELAGDSIRVYELDV